MSLSSRDGCCQTIRLAVLGNLEVVVQGNGLFVRFPQRPGNIIVGVVFRISLIGSSANRLVKRQGSPGLFPEEILRCPRSTRRTFACKRAAAGNVGSWHGGGRSIVGQSWYWSSNSTRYSDSPLRGLPVLFTAPKDARTERSNTALLPDIAISCFELFGSIAERGDWIIFFTSFRANIMFFITVKATFLFALKIHFAK